MKKLLFVSVVSIGAGFSGQAFALGGTLSASPAALCDGTAGSAPVAAIAGTAGFVKTNFTFQCSNNVQLKAADNATSVSAASSSKKGKTVYQGGTNGGSITPTACTFSSALCDAPTDTQTVANFASS